MKKNYLLSILMLVVFISSVSAYDPNKPLENILSPIGDQIISYLPFGQSGDGGVYNLFYPVQQWEIDVCSNGLTSEFKSKSAGGDTYYQGYANIYAPITSTLNAAKIIYDENETLYEVSWYIQPKSSELKYSLYFLTASNTKKYLPKPGGGEMKDVTSDPAQGDAGYYAEYLTEKYVRIVLDYGSGKVDMLIPEK
jgi:hypothetical protein